MSRWVNIFLVPLAFVFVLGMAYLLTLGDVRTALVKATSVTVKPGDAEKKTERVENPGVLNKAWDSAAGLLAGKCSVRSKSIPLTAEWYDLIDNEDDCWVVAYSVPGTVEGEDSRGKFNFTGLTRNPTRVRAKSGTAYFKYSLCPTNLRGQLLDWKCNPQKKSAQR